MIGFYGMVLCCYSKRFSFSLKVSFSLPRPGFLVGDAVYIVLFLFPFLFPSYCHSGVHRVVSIVSDGCNQSSFVFFYVVLGSFFLPPCELFYTSVSRWPLTGVWMKDSLLRYPGLFWVFGLVDWGNKIYRLLLCRWERLPSTKYPEYDLNNLIVKFQ